MISCSRCLAALGTLQRARACSISTHLIRNAFRKTTYNSRRCTEVQNFVSTNRKFRATFIQSRDQNGSERISEKEIETHEEETEEIHDDYLQASGSQITYDVEIRLEGVPPIPGHILEKPDTSRKKKNLDKPELEGEASIKPKKKQKQSIEEMKKVAIEIEKKKEISFRNSLKSYLTMCMQQNMVYKAMMLLRNYHGDEKYVQSSEVYDAVLKEAAHSCSWKLIKDVVVMMEEKSVPFSLNSFAACFVCLGRRSVKETNLRSLSENLLDKMDSCGLNFQDIFTKCKFTNDNRVLAVQGIRQAIPDFDPPFPSFSSSYTTPLLSSLNDLKVDSPIDSPVSGLLTSDTLMERISKQFQSESSGVMVIRSIMKSSSMDAGATSEMEKLELEWSNVIREAIVRDLSVCKAQFESTRRKTLHIYPFLAALSTDDYVKLLSQEVQMLSGTSDLFSPSMSIFCRNLGLKVMNKARIQRKTDNGQLDKFRKIYQEYCQWYLEPNNEGLLYNPRQMWQKLVENYRNEGPDLDAEEILWPYSVVQAVGQFLYNIILSNLKINDSGCVNANPSPAFYVVFRTKGVKAVKEIKPHPLLVKLHDEIRKEKLSFDASLLPMLSPPLPWHSYRHGGYLATDVSLVRLPPYASQQRFRLENNPAQQLFPALDALNALGSIPWRINSAILDLVIQIFNSNGDKELDVPQPPSALQPPLPIPKESPQTEKSKAMKDRAAFKRRKAEMYSLWCDTLYRLSLANHFRDRIFWLPHNMDFRGRVYPCSPHLTHLSHDMARSLLYFARGKPLGEDGLNWLKLHVINLTGTKKREPVSHRLIYADEILDDILDSADNPLSGRKWWVKSDEPWQTLAACIEVAAAIRHPGGPASYVCHLPIHQDGSCNGLQHYAALGRDQIGAESVNLAPAEKPQDVYSNVAILVERERVKDASNGVEIAQLLSGHISRKVIKQTVMTTVYGVTRYGARLQIAKQLKEIPTLSNEQVNLGASYLADKTFQSLQEMFTSAKEIQDWFTESAKLISTVVGENVEWITPVGLPVVQPYNKNPYDESSRPNVMKQRNAFPPNFIHSLDSSHMMLTALHCQRKGITFASIHDCFWTHPCTVNQMNKICREQFVSLHSEPILEDLSKFMVSQFGNRASDENEEDTPKGLARHRLNQILSEVPRRGTFDLRLVLDSVYFFS